MSTQKVGGPSTNPIRYSSTASPQVSTPQASPVGYTSASTFSSSQSASSKKLSGKELENALFNLDMMRNLFNMMEEGSKKMIEEMKKALRKMGLEVPEEVSVPGLATMWDQWAYREAVKLGMPEEDAKKRFLG